MIVKLDLDPKLLWDISEEAERRQISASEYIVRAIQGKERIKRRGVERGQATRKWVGELHAEGLTDSEIASQLRLNLEHIRRLRATLGLKPNKKAA